LQSVLAPCPGKLLVDDFAIEHDHAWTDSLELLMKGFPSSSELPSQHVGATLRWALHYVRQPNPKLGHTHTIERLQAFRYESAFMEQRPKLITTTGVVAANSGGDRTRITSYDDDLASFGQ